MVAQLCFISMGRILFYLFMGLSFIHFSCQKDAGENSKKSCETIIRGYTYDEATGEKISGAKIHSSWFSSSVFDYSDDEGLFNLENHIHQECDPNQVLTCYLLTTSDGRMSFDTISVSSGTINPVDIHLKKFGDNLGSYFHLDSNCVGSINISSIPVSEINFTWYVARAQVTSGRLTVPLSMGSTFENYEIIGDTTIYFQSSGDTTVYHLYF